MSDEEKYIITVRFPEWEQKDFEDETKVYKFPSFGVKYLFTTGVIPTPEWADDDERWLTYTTESVVSSRFIDAYTARHKEDFNGEILFVEPTDLVNLTDRENK